MAFFRKSVSPIRANCQDKAVAFISPNGFSTLSILNASLYEAFITTQDVPSFTNNLIEESVTELKSPERVYSNSSIESHYEHEGSGTLCNMRICTTVLPLMFAFAPLYLLFTQLSSGSETSKQVMVLRFSLREFRQSLSIPGLPSP